jgi:hypothetical protein
VIVRAAIMRDGGVWSEAKPARHHNILAQMRICGFAQLGPPREVQGFLRDDGHFLDREAAAEHAIVCGQIQPGPSATGREPGYLNHGPSLFSEDLW